MKINKWLTHEFESSSSTTPEFASFARDFRAHIKANIPEGAKIARFSRGHFYVAGHIERNGKFVYFSVSDVRHFPNDWYHRVLIRTATSEKDFTGGPNVITTLQNFPFQVERLLKR